MFAACSSEYAPIAFIVVGAVFLLAGYYAAPLASYLLRSFLHSVDQKTGEWILRIGWMLLGVVFFGIGLWTLLTEACRT